MCVTSVHQILSERKNTPSPAAMIGRSGFLGRRILAKRKKKNPIKKYRCDHPQLYNILVSFKGLPAIHIPAAALALGLVYAYERNAHL